MASSVCWWAWLAHSRSRFAARICARMLHLYVGRTAASLNSCSGSHGSARREENTPCESLLRLLSVGANGSSRREVAKIPFFKGGCQPKNHTGSETRGGNL